MVKNGNDCIGHGAPKLCYGSLKFLLFELMNWVEYLPADTNPCKLKVTFFTFWVDVVKNQFELSVHWASMSSNLIFGWVLSKIDVTFIRINQLSWGFASR